VARHGSAEPAILWKTKIFSSEQFYCMYISPRGVSLKFSKLPPIDDRGKNYVNCCNFLLITNLKKIMSREIISRARCGGGVE
jgi:hypothetical protein